MNQSHKQDLFNTLKSFRETKRTLLATNFYNFETLIGVLNAYTFFKEKKNQNIPLIMQLTESSIKYMGIETAIAMARSALKEHGLKGWLHLDHGGSIDLVEKALNAGVDSVMIDGSELPIDENIELTRKVIALAKPFGAQVEAELGYIAKLGQTKKMEYTLTEDARRFVQSTGVHSLAVAIGNAHGFYKDTPQLNIERLAEIQRACQIPLVLHGSSGIPDQQLKEAVGNGICKVNLATELKDAFMGNVKKVMTNSDEIDLRKVFPPAIQAVTDVVLKKLAVLAP